jgi:hypothetical protein
MLKAGRLRAYASIRVAANTILMLLAAVVIMVTSAKAGNELRSSPPDTTSYSRPLISEDLIRPSTTRKVPTASFFIVDTVVNNADPNLKLTDMFGDQETSIAVNPINPEEIAITAFSGGWIAGGPCQAGTLHVNAPLWLSENGGHTWAKKFVINPPPGVGGIVGSPCDQTVDFGFSGRLAGAFLAFTDNIFTSRTIKPGLPWKWPTPVAQATNHLDGVNNEDQPWQLVGPDPEIVGGTNVYVAYDDFNTAPNMRVATATGVDPLNFTTDTSPGPSAGFVNPGHRLAIDPVTADVYSIFQRAIGPGNINYILNRSRDEASTWDFGIGVLVVNGLSTQPTPKFCTVNALLGGVDHAAVDPQTGDVIYVYGKQDGTGVNQLAMKRLGFTASGPMPIGPELPITNGPLNTAIPSVAVTENGTIGVFYYTCDSVPPTSTFPIFTAHFAISTNGGLSFVDTDLETFMSSALDDGDPRQGVLGDYMQVKALGNTFFGSFTGNGAPFGRAISNNDPIFYAVTIS